MRIHARSLSDLLESCIPGLSIEFDSKKNEEYVEFETGGCHCCVPFDEYSSDFIFEATFTDPKTGTVYRGGLMLEGRFFVPGISVILDEHVGNYEPGRVVVFSYDYEALAAKKREQEHELEHEYAENHKDLDPRSEFDLDYSEGASGYFLNKVFDPDVPFEWEVLWREPAFYRSSNFRFLYDEDLWIPERPKTPS